MTTIGLSHEDDASMHDIPGKITLKLSNPKSVSSLTQTTATGLGKDFITPSDKFEIQRV